MGCLASMPQSTLNIGIVVSEKTDSSVVTKLDNELDRTINQVKNELNLSYDIEFVQAYIAADGSMPWIYP
jgi:hypothetical protein